MNFRGRAQVGQGAPLAPARIMAPMRLLCIHGHFYQPPRENPWLEAVEVQDSAAPYHDWNERITAECYAPNARGAHPRRPRTGSSRSSTTTRGCSFNFGPTLLVVARGARARGLRARSSRPTAQRASGSAATATRSPRSTTTSILPLAHARDKRTQVLWGIADFRHRFGREPEGMWLPRRPSTPRRSRPLAAEGIRFTVLAPYQARGVRAARRRVAGREPAGHRPVAALPRARCRRARSIAVFFYDGPIARDVAFEGALGSARGSSTASTGGFDRGRASTPSSCTSPPTASRYGHHQPARRRWRSPTRCAQLERRRRRRADQLRRVPRAASRPSGRSEIARGHVVELRARRRALAPRLRLPDGGTAGLAPGVARAAARGARLAARSRSPRSSSARSAARSSAIPWAARDAYIEVVLDRRAATRPTFLAAPRRAGARRTTSA